MTSLTDAIILASTFHSGQVDKGGKPYILHPLRVMLKGKTELERVVGVLHDIVEDTEMTLEGLTNHGFNGHVVDAVDLLTRRTDETYNAYVDRIAMGSHLAMQVKLYDLEDNMDLARLPRDYAGQLPGYDRYAKTYLRLKNLLEF